MKSHIAALTPQMRHYHEELHEDGQIRWLPYVMYFHPAGHRSEIVNTDRFGFRITHGRDGERAGVGDQIPDEPVNLLAGGSAAFGVGATADAATLSSRLWSEHAPGRPWLNLGGRSHNSAQELVLFLLHRHLLPEVGEIVLYSGFNNLGLARQPRSPHWDHGAFFQHNEFTGKMAGPPPSSRDPRSSGPVAELDASPVPEAAAQVAIAAELTLRHLESWRLIADALGARLTYVLQPMAPWVRERPAAQEQLIFDELDELFSFREMFGDILPAGVGRDYAQALRTGCERLGVPFLDLNPVLAEETSADDWLFVDRAHLTDEGNDIVAGLLADRLGLK